MKVCILSNDDPAAFQSSINAFIADKKVIDIKYQSMNHSFAAILCIVEQELATVPTL